MSRATGLLAAAGGGVALVAIVAVVAIILALLGGITGAFVGWLYLDVLGWSASLTIVDFAAVGSVVAIWTGISGDE